MSDVLLSRARELRKNQTPHEGELWQLLRGRRFFGHKFYRQFVIKNYIADFYCPEKNLIIELDGSGHLEENQQNYDQEREKYLRENGYQVFRIWNHEWRDHRDVMLEKLAALLNQL